MNSTTIDNYDKCHLHPKQAVTGFCAVCLRERLHTQEIQAIDLETHFCPSSQQQQQGKKLNERKQVKELNVIKDPTDIGVPSQGKKLGSLWIAASVFSKKLQNWRMKQKLKRQSSSKAAMRAQKPDKLSQRFRDSQSDMGLDALGRRSCDYTDPRFSLDEPRFSLDQPRASCDGYFSKGGRSGLPRLNSTVLRSDGLIPVEEDSLVPGGSAQTRDYYLDSSSRRRRSFDRSSSVRELPFECNVHKSGLNAVINPAAGAELGGLLDRELSDWQSKTLRDDYFGNFESVCRDVSKEAAKKKSRRWNKAWNIWEFLQPKAAKASLDDNSKSISEPWPGRQSQGCDCKISQSNNDINFRHSFSANVGYGSMNGSNLNMEGHPMTKRTGKFVFDRNRSSRYSSSPTQSDNGMLRFYLTPTRNRWKNGGGSGNGQHISSNYLTKTMLGLY